MKKKTKNLAHRELLRLHVESVWGVQLPLSIDNDITIVPEGAMPSWSLYVAQLANERIYIWRPDVSSENRLALLERVHEAFSLLSTDSLAPNIRREVALHIAAQPTIDKVVANQIAQPITVSTHLEGYHFTPQQEPVIGVMREGRLLCVAHSAHRTAQACELGIDTQVEARRKGYALAATVLWTEAVAKVGLVPLYSALLENEASLRLAAAAGYREFARAVYTSERDSLEED